MKHNIKITLVLLIMFFATQLIGLFVMNAYSPQNQLVYNQTSSQYENVSIAQELPYGLQPPEQEASFNLLNILISMVFAILLILLLMKINARLFLRIWFFLVVIIAISVTLNSVIFEFIKYSPWIVLLLSVPLAYVKIFRRNILVHNITELLIYPGIAVIFASMLNLWAVVVLLLLISVYDIYAVWHAKFMQKMAKFQINELKIFAGFFIPYLNKKQRAELKQSRSQKFSKTKMKNKQMKVSLAILGGGDVVFPLILAGVVLKIWGIIPAIIISIFATIALLILFIIARKGKFYPAMPFITAGCLVGLFFSYLASLLL